MKIELVDLLRHKGCRLATPPQMLIVVYRATNGDPCRTGCAYYEGGRCPAYAALSKPPALPTSTQGETVRQAAQRLGVSVSEIRRRRAQS